MDEREELKEELKLELQWVKYRIRMLDIIEEKLIKLMSYLLRKGNCDLGKIVND